MSKYREVIKTKKRAASFMKNTLLMLEGTILSRQQAKLENRETVLDTSDKFLLLQITKAIMIAKSVGI